MQLIQYKIDVENLHGEPFVVAPLGDIQWDGMHESTSIQIIKKHIGKVLTQNGKFIGMGDYTDLASPSNRQRLAQAVLYDTAQNIIDNAGTQLIDSLIAEILLPTTGQWLGMLEGHHFLQLQTGYTTDQLLCERLQTIFLGTCAYIGLQFMNGKHPIGTVNIWCHHGTGSGVSMASPIQKLEKIASVWDANIYLMGHQTKRASAPILKMYPDWTRFGKAHKLRATERHLIGTGGFSRAYQENCKQGNVPRGGYVERGMMTPVVIGAPIIYIEPRIINRDIDGKRHNYFQPEIRVEV